MEEVDALYREVGRRIARLRRAKGLTQERLAEHVELNPSYLARVEAGARRATVETLVRIAGALDTSIGELFASEGSDRSAEVPRALRSALRGLSEQDVMLLAQVAGRFVRPPKAARKRSARGRKA